MRSYKSCNSVIALIAIQHTVEVRIIVSSRDAGQSWDSRCEVREKLISYLQKHYPESLPRIRTAFTSDGNSEEALNVAVKRPERRAHEVAAVNS